MDPLGQSEHLRKRFNVDSPSFTPGGLAANGNAAKNAGLSPRAASAAPFKPRSATPTSSVGSYSGSTPASSAAPQSVKSYNPAAADWYNNAGDAQEFHPQGYNNNTFENGQEYNASSEMYDNGGSSGMDSQQSTFHYGPNMNGSHAATYMSQSSHTSQFLHHHLYAPLDPRLSNAKPYQRFAKDVFIPEDLRLKLHKKTEATLRSFANSQLPNIEYFHTLTPLEGVNQHHHSRSSSAGAPRTTVYKAVSDQDGRTYCLRRIHDVRLLRESESAQAIATHKSRWARVSSNSVVATYLAFSTQMFGDTSVIVVTDFYPDSTTLQEKYLSSGAGSFRSSGNSFGRAGGLGAAGNSGSSGFGAAMPEQVLWNYIVQLANALKSIHANNLAARSLDAKQCLITDENRVRFNGCGVADITNPASNVPLQDLQRLDLVNLGQLVFQLGSSGSGANLGTNASNDVNRARAGEYFARAYSPRMRHAVEWLQQSASANGSARTIGDFSQVISEAVMSSMDSALGQDDFLQHHLNRELENSRLVRLLLKLNMINDRPEYDENENCGNGSTSNSHGSLAWRDQGQRAAIKLFRDYVFHQVDASGRPVVDLGHMLACLNKLDVGVEERITLTTRNEQTVMIVSYRELRSLIDGSWAEIVRRTAAPATTSTAGGGHHGVMASHVPAASG